MNEDWADKIFKYALPVFLGLCGVVFIISLVAGIIGLNNNTVETKEIMSINLTEEMSGRFILGFGSVKTEEYYITYEVLEDGGKKLLKLPSDKIIIYDNLSNNETPYVEITYIADSGYYKSINLYVPKGTITEEYNLDIKS